MVQASEIIWCKLAIKPPVPSEFTKITKRYKSLLKSVKGFEITSSSSFDKGYCLVIDIFGMVLVLAIKYLVNQIRGHK